MKMETLGYLTIGGTALVAGTIGYMLGKRSTPKAIAPGGALRMAPRRAPVTVPRQLAPAARRAFAENVLKQIGLPCGEYRLYPLSERSRFVYEWRRGMLVIAYSFDPCAAQANIGTEWTRPSDWSSDDSAVLAMVDELCPHVTPSCDGYILGTAGKP